MELTEYLNEKHLTVATAESCTGGMLAKLITDESGVSAVFDGGIVTYANRIKTALVGVKETTLAQHGAVSAETAEEMARGVAKTIGADLGVSTTGIAGPGGGTPEKPVGTVFVGLYYAPADKLRVLPLHLHGTRDEIRRQVCETAFREALALLKEEN